MYAVIEERGKQIRVSVGQEVCVEKIDGDLNSEVVMDKVLMVSRDDKIVYGRPYVEGASVKAEILKTGKMAKVLILRPRPKKAYRRLKGHRQLYATLKIKEIIGG